MSSGTKALFQVESTVSGSWSVTCRFCDWQNRFKSRYVARQCGHDHYRASHIASYDGADES